jgi:DNA polymerase-3 subunit gamma/tau
MRDAQSLLEQVLAFSSDGGVEAEILDLLGVIDRQSILQAGRAVLTGDAVACLRLVDDLYQRGLDIKRFSRRLCEHFRNLLVFALGGDGAAGMLDLPADDVAALAADVRDVTAESLQIYFQVLLKGEEEIRRSDLPRVALEMLLLRLAQLPRLESLEAVLTRLEDLEQAFAGGPAADLSAGASAVGGVSRRAPGESTGPAAKSSPLPAEEPPGWVTAPIKGPFEAPAGADIPAGPGPLPSRDPLRDWPEFLQWLRKAEPFLEAKLAQSRVAAAEGGGSSLELTVPGIFEEAVSEPRTLEKLTAAASRFFSRDVHWVVRTAKPGEANGQAHGAHRATKPGRQRKVIEHPLVQQALEILGGELVDIRRVPPAAPAPGGAAASRRGRRVAEKAKDARPPATR